MTDDPTPAEIEAGARAFADEALDSAGRWTDRATPREVATAVLRAVLPAHDARIRAEVADRIIQALETEASRISGESVARAETWVTFSLDTGDDLAGLAARHDAATHPLADTADEHTKQLSYEDVRNALTIKGRYQPCHECASPPTSYPGGVTLRGLNNFDPTVTPHRADCSMAAKPSTDPPEPAVERPTGPGAGSDTHGGAETATDGPRWDQEVVVGICTLLTPEGRRHIDALLAERDRIGREAIREHHRALYAEAGRNALAKGYDALRDQASALVRDRDAARAEVERLRAHVARLQKALGYHDAIGPLVEEDEHR